MAWEVVDWFQGQAYEAPDNEYIGRKNNPKKTPEFKEYEAKRYRRMKWGIGLLSAGFLLQGVGVWL